MQRYILVNIAAWLMFATIVQAQQGAPSVRMGPQEANAIAEYWINSYLRRTADPREVEQWASEIVKSRSPADALAGFLSSREYLQYSGGTRAGLTQRMEPPQIAYEFLRQSPKNWWPGPNATPPRELRHLYDHYGAPPRW